MEPSFIDKLEAISSRTENFDENTLRQELQGLDQMIHQVGVQKLFQNPEQLKRAHQLLSDLSERIRPRFSKEGEHLAELAQTIMPVPALPEETWGEIMTQAESQDLGRLRTDRMTSKMSEAEKLKRVESGELDVRVFGCKTAKEAIACLKEKQLTLADLSWFSLTPKDVKELIRECPDLKELILPELCLIPPEIENLKKLKKLSCTDIGMLPAEIGNLTQLEELTLNATYPLPETFGKLSQLQTLRLTATGGMTVLQSIPRELNLQTLVLKNDLGEEMPSSIYQLKQLETLVIKGGIRLAPDIQNLTSLKVLEIKEEPLPAEIGMLQQLQRLQVRGDIEDLPDSVGDLKNLQVFDLSKSRIKKLPDSIGNLENLKILKLDFNPYLQGSEVLNRLIDLEQIEFYGKRVAKEQLTSAIRDPNAAASLAQAIPSLCRKILKEVNEQDRLKGTLGVFLQRDFSTMSTEQIYSWAKVTIWRIRDEMKTIPEEIRDILVQMSNWADQLI